MRIQYLAQGLAERHHVPTATLRAFAAAVAERCALIANRYEPEGEVAAVDAGIVEAVGAQIGAAILRQFPEPEAQAPADPTRARIGGRG